MEPRRAYEVAQEKFAPLEVNFMAWYDDATYMFGVKSPNVEQGTDPFYISDLDVQEITYLPFQKNLAKFKNALANRIDISSFSHSIWFDYEDAKHSMM